MTLRLLRWFQFWLTLMLLFASGLAMLAGMLFVLHLVPLLVAWL